MSSITDLYNLVISDEPPVFSDNLYLSGTDITALPDNLSVGGDLYLSGTDITALPDNLSVGGDLYLNGTAIPALPDNLSVGGKVIGFDGTSQKHRADAGPAAPAL